MTRTYVQHEGWNEKTMNLWKVFPNVKTQSDPRRHPVCAGVYFPSNYSLYLSLSSHPTLDAFLHLHTHALLLMPPPWAYTLLNAQFPSICQENWGWTLKMSHEMRRGLGISLQVGQFKQIRLPYCQETHLQQRGECLSDCRQPDSLRWTLTLDGLNRKEMELCSKSVNTFKN